MLVPTDLGFFASRFGHLTYAMKRAQGWLVPTVLVYLFTASAYCLTVNAL